MHSHAEYVTEGVRHANATDGAVLAVTAVRFMLNRGVPWAVRGFGLLCVLQLGTGCILLAANAVKSKPKVKQYDMEAATRCPAGTRLIKTSAHEYCSLPSGQRHGVYVRFHENGKKRLEVRFSNGLMHGTLVQRNHQGDWRGADGSMFDLEFIDGSGKWLLYTPTGGKEQEGELVAGKRHGKWTEWTAGAVSYEGTYDRGKRLGEHRWFFASRRARVVATYENGVLRSAQAWFDNGMSRARGSFVDDFPDGRWVYWHNDGSKKAEGLMLRGQRDGAWTTWQAGGTNQQVEHWQRGALLRRGPQ